MSISIQINYLKIIGIVFILNLFFLTKGQAQFILNNEEYIRYSPKLEYKIISNGYGPYIKDSDMVFVNLIQSVGDTITNNTLRNTGAPFLTAFYNAANNNAIGPLFFKVRAGDSIVIRRNVDSFFSETKRPPYFKDGDEILERYQIVSILPASKKDSIIKAIDQSLIDAKNRLADDRQRDPKHRLALTKRDRNLLLEYCGINEIDPIITESGLFYVITKQGVGPLIKNGNTVKINFTSTLLDGRVINSNTDAMYGKVKPFEYKIGTLKLMPGIDEGIKYCKKGTKITLLIPSLLAYGEFPPKNSIVDAYAVIRYDIEVLSVKK
jgi:FKBP-type peptidyl-prolyl cis-trans isomerase FkpA